VIPDNKHSFLQYRKDQEKKHLQLIKDTT